MSNRERVSRPVLITNSLPVIKIFQAMKEKNNFIMKAFPESRYLDQMFGNDLLSRYIKGKTSYEEVLAQMEKDKKAFEEKCWKHFLYD